MDDAAPKRRGGNALLPTIATAVNPMGSRRWIIDAMMRVEGSRSKVVSPIIHFV